MELTIESFKPVWNKIIVEEIEQTLSKTILIPDSAKGKSNVGKVLKTGKGDIDEKGNYLPREVNEGDFIMFREFAGTPIYFNQNGVRKKFFLMRMDQVLGIFE